MSTTTFSDQQRDAVRRGWTLPHLLVIPAVAFGMWMIYHPWPANTGLCQVGWILFTSYALLSLSSCFHETTHQTYSGSTFVSIWVGRLIGTMLLVPYTAYRETHIRHHAYLNTPSDWELWPYSDPRSPRWFRRLFVWCDLFLGFLTTPVIYGRIFFHKKSPLKSPRIRITIWLEYLAIAAAWGGLLAVLKHYHVLRTSYSQWALAMFAMTFLQTGRKLTEHLGMASFDPIQGTRTVLGPGWLTRLTTYMQFDIFIHGPHHRYPRMPHAELKQAIAPYLGETGMQAPVFRSYAQAILDMLPWMWLNPGVGVNVGAPVVALSRDAAQSGRVLDFAAPGDADEHRHSPPQELPLRRAA
jgi:fatty acid desaturase